MTDEPILEVPGYTPPEPEPVAAPRVSFLIDAVPFSPPPEAPAPPVPARAANFIDSVPVASTAWSVAPVAPPAPVAPAAPVASVVPAAPVAPALPAPDVVPPPYVSPTEVAPPLAPAAPALVATWANEPTQPVAPGADPLMAPDDDPFSDWLDVPTEAGAVAPPAAASAVAPPVASPMEDLDEVDVTRRVVGRVPTVTLTWDDGTMTYVTTPTLLGRNPSSSGSDLAVAIADTTLSLSKTHARLTSSPPSIEDLDSTNGVEIERAGRRVGVPRRLATSIAAGDVLYFGNRRAVVEVVS